MDYTLEELKKQYAESRVGDETIEVRPRIYEYKNEGLRRELLKKADKLLSEDKQLAIVLHSKLCYHNHVDGCMWGYEIDELERDWTSGEHKRYLEKAAKMLNIVDFETAVKLVECLSNQYSKQLHNELKSLLCSCFM